MEFESLYCHGLVEKKDKWYVRDYYVNVLVINKDGKKAAIHVEVKAQMVADISQRVRRGRRCQSKMDSNIGE